MYKKFEKKKVMGVFFFFPFPMIPYLRINVYFVCDIRVE